MACRFRKDCCFYVYRYIHLRKTYLVTEGIWVICNLATLFICKAEVYIITPIFVLFSDTDSDSTDSTTSSSSCSPSTVSDEDDHPNEKDNKSYCVKTKDELPIDVSTLCYLLNVFLVTQLKIF